MIAGGGVNWLSKNASAAFTLKYFQELLQCCKRTITNRFITEKGVVDPVVSLSLF
jgi:hypothetical protein